MSDTRSPMSETDTEPIVDAETVPEPGSVAEPQAVIQPGSLAEPQAAPQPGSLAEPQAVTQPEEAVDGLPVLAEVRTLEPTGRQTLPAVQAAAAAATGFVAGAATVALVRRHASRKLVRRSVGRRAADMLPVVGSRTFLVDVHLLAKPGE